MTGSTSFDDVVAKTDDPVFLPGELLTAATAGVGAAAITTDEVSAILAEAQRRLIASLPADASVEALVLSVNVEVADLGGLVLARVVGNTIFIDADAAGHVWFVDATPADDSEFESGVGDGLVAPPSSDAYGRMDLLSALMHELGHVAGLDHNDAGEAGLMSESLYAGSRLSDTAESEGDDLAATYPVNPFLLYASYLLSDSHLLIDVQGLNNWRLMPSNSHTDEWRLSCIDCLRH